MGKDGKFDLEAPEKAPLVMLGTRTHSEEEAWSSLFFDCSRKYDEIASL
jgi:hypothetical protein